MLLDLGSINYSLEIFYVTSHYAFHVVIRAKDLGDLLSSWTECIANEGGKNILS